MHRSRPAAPLPVLLLLAAVLARTLPTASADTVRLSAADVPHTAPFVVAPHEATQVPVLKTLVTETRFCGDSPADAAYAVVPNKFGNNPDNSETNAHVAAGAGTARFSFPIAAGGVHQILAEVSTPSSASNSFHVRLDDGGWFSWSGVPVTGGEMRSIVLARRPSSPVVGVDLLCWDLSPGVHTIDLRWRELGTEIRSLEVSDAIPPIAVLSAVGCSEDGVTGCETSGGTRITLDTQALCPDAVVSVAGVPCTNSSIDAGAPARGISCLLPAGAGANLPLTVSSAGRTVLVDGGLSYAAPIVEAASGCARDEPPFTSDCEPGDTLTLTGGNFGGSGATVTLNGVPCTGVAHDASNPHNRLTCTVGDPDLPANAGAAAAGVRGLRLVQAIPEGMAGDATAAGVTAGSSSPLFTGAEYKPAPGPDVLVIATSVVAGIIALALLAFGARRIFLARRAVAASKQLLDRRPWRANVVALHDKVPRTGGAFACTVAIPGTETQFDALAYVVGRSVDPFAVDLLAEKIVNSNAPVLDSFIGASFSARRPPVLVVLRDSIDDVRGTGPGEKYRPDPSNAGRRVTERDAAAGVAESGALGEDDSTEAAQSLANRSFRSVVTSSPALASSRMRLSWATSIIRGCAVLHSMGVCLRQLNPDTCFLSASTAGGASDSPLSARIRGTIVGRSCLSALASGSVGGGVPSRAPRDVNLFGKLAGFLLAANGATVFCPADTRDNDASDMGSARSGGMKSDRAASARFATDTNSLRSNDSSHVSGNRYAVRYLLEVHLLDGIPPAVEETLALCFGDTDSRPPASLLATVLESAERELSVRQLVQRRTAQLAASQARSDELLARMIPPKFIEDVKAGLHVPANVYNNVTVIFLDVIEFTSKSSRVEPDVVFNTLSEMTTILDKIAAEEGITRVNTIGDAYFAVCGAPNPVENHCAAAVRFSFRAIVSLARLTLAGDPLRVRVGVNSGPIAGGIQGGSVKRFDILGDTVNIASRMESNGVPGKVHMTRETAELLRSQDPRAEYNIKDRGQLEIKGKGTMITCIVDRF